MKCPQVLFITPVSAFSRGGTSDRSSKVNDEGGTQALLSGKKDAAHWQAAYGGIASQGIQGTLRGKPGQRAKNFSDSRSIGRVEPKMIDDSLMHPGDA